ncbi:hypothetical protein [Roseateles sp. LYH14W]|uniref:Uncharacterized protein n=1 Tax=Pelomonas parva TaxID=3299032 RepID=A0ABW7F950_9BURK
MNTLKLLAVTVCSFAMAAPALAGPDWSAIEQARKLRRAASTETAPAATRVAHAEPATNAACTTAAPLLQPDHGPRPVTTPQANRVRVAEHKAALGNCMLAAR